MNYLRLDNVVRLFLHYLNRFPGETALRAYVIDLTKSITQIEQEIKNSEERKKNIKRWYVEILGRSKEPSDVEIAAHLASDADYTQHRLNFVASKERAKRVAVPSLNELFDSYDYSDDLTVSCTTAALSADGIRSGVAKVGATLDDINTPVPIPPVPGDPMTLGVRSNGSLNGTDLIGMGGLLIGVGHYTFLSNPQDHVKSVQDIASYGFNLLRVFSSLPRNPEGLPGNPSDWWISPWDDRTKYTRILNETLEECFMNRIRLLYCYFDEETRTDNVQFDRDQNTWRGDNPSFEVATDIIDYLTDPLLLKNMSAFLPELMNEPPGNNDTWDSAWNPALISYLSPVSDNPVNIDYENPVGKTILWEHAHPGYHSGGGLNKDGAEEILATMRRWRTRYRERGAAVHVGISTDGVREDRIWNTEEFAKMMVGEGFSCELMMSYRAPERWSANDKKIVERFAKGAGL